MRNSSHDSSQRAAAMTKSDAAKYIGISERYLDKLIANGSIPKVKLGRKTLLRTTDIEALLEANLKKPPRTHCDRFIRQSRTNQSGKTP